MKLSRLFASLALLAFCAVTLFAFYRTNADTPRKLPLAAYAPPGALLALESPDFRTLLQAWSSSAEEQRWLVSDDYAGFARSRLFGRLKEAQDEFATAAGLAPDSRFLTSVAGRETLFAWYDIGKLEFLYITRLPSGETQTLPLLALRDRYGARTAGGTPFYLRSGGDAARTVAFAVHGDLLLLATREDLLTSALESIAHPSLSTLGHEPWFAAAEAAGPSSPGDLRMSLHLASVVRSPYFRTYWVQRNITELKTYSAEISDLYRSPEEFREERVLLPAPATTAATPTLVTDLAPILRFVPSGAVYKASAHPQAEAVLAQLEGELLARSPVGSPNAQIAPAADTSVPNAGTATDLEQRIDEPAVTDPGQAVALEPLRAELRRAEPVAMLVLSRLNGAVDERTPGTADAASRVFHPVHSAVVLQANRPWNQAALQAAISAALAPRLTVAALGLVWETTHDGRDQTVRLRGLQSLALRLDGNLCILASDYATLDATLSAASKASLPPVLAQERAGADLRTARAPLIALTKQLDHNIARPEGSPGGAPPFFSGNMASLAQTFGDVVSETFTQTSSAGDTSTHQQVIYRWRP